MTDSFICKCAKLIRVESHIHLRNEPMDKWVSASNSNEHNIYFGAKLVLDLKQVASIGVPRRYSTSTWQEMSPAS